jgi:sulfate permease, SulP family
MHSWSKWLPNSVSAIRNYSLKDFLADLPAGITVGLVALPLAMAFAIASGVPPQAGIYCAVITGFLISALGGSNVQIGGPTGAFVVVVAGIIAKHGLGGLFVCTMMAGVMLVIMGATGLGRAIRYIPRPVVLGFTNGIAVLIASTQLRDFFGLQLSSVPGEFIARMRELARHFGTVSPAATLLAVISLVLILLTPKLTKRVPGYIVALIAGTAVVAFFKLPVETIGSRFGGIPTGLPRVDIPDFRPDMVLPLLSSAVTVAMLGAIESLMSAVVADRMTGAKHNPNVELVAQGVANIFSPMFGGLPATGAIARTATNVRSGARTPVSGIIHAATLLVVLLVAAPLAKFVPMAVLAAILLVVSYNMGEWGETAKLLKLNKSAIAVWLVTFTLTVIADLTHAVEFGMILAALMFIQKVSETTTVSEVTPEYINDGHAHILQHKHIPDYVAIFRIHGPFMFGTTEKLSVVTEMLDELPPIVVLRLRNMTALDSTGIKEFEELAAKLHATDRTLILCGAREQPAKLIHQADFEDHIGRDNICANIKHALDRAHRIMHGYIAADTVPHIRGANAGS